jgi:hypothetical protein
MLGASLVFERSYWQDIMMCVLYNLQQLRSSQNFRRLVQ